MGYNNLSELLNQPEGASVATIRAALQAGLRVAGEVTLVSGQTTIAVTHGIGATPSPEDIQVTPIESLGNASFFWVDTLTSTQFTININGDAAADVDFAWRADIM